MGLTLIKNKYFKYWILNIFISNILTIKVIIYFINAINSLGNHIYIFIKTFAFRYKAALINWCVRKQEFGALAAPGPKRPKPTKRTLKNTERIPLRCMHHRGGIYQATVVHTHARPLKPRPAMDLYNKNRRIPHHKVGKPLLKRHLIKYKAY